MTRTIRHLFLLLCVALLCVSAGCKPTKLSTANEQLERGEYFEASKTYRKIYNKLTKREDRPLRGEVAYRMGTCYRKLNMAARATAAYQNAIRYEYPDSMAFYYLGRSLQAEGKYAPAIDAYRTFLEWRPNDELALEGVNGCEASLRAKEEGKSRYIVKNAKLFNSRRADYAPMYYGAEMDQIYFTSSNEKVTGDGKSEITGMKRSDIYFSKKNERGEWQRPEAVEGDLNTEHEEGVCSFSPDGQTMYLTVSRRQPDRPSAVEIYTSKRGDGTWSAPQKYEVVKDTVSSVGHPSVSPDGRYLYFSSDMMGGFGGKDIWRISLTDRAGSLENLGPDINTAGDEMFPYVRTDSVLYFSSDGHPGYGGLDLYRAKLRPAGEGRWDIENMGQPMNSSGDDFGITFGPGETGFFSSNRGDGRGYDHIYSFELPELQINISGWVVDLDDEPVPNAVIRIVGDNGSNQKEVAKDDGSFIFKLDRGVKYVMMAGAKGYLNVKQEFESDSAEEDAEYSVDFILPSIDKSQTVENIFYDFDKATLRPESEKALDELVVLLKDNPTVTLAMTSHADRWGSDEYNDDLSERRAKAVVDYLTSKGVSERRLTYEGKGKRVPKSVTKKVNAQYPQFEEGTLLDEEFVLTLSEEDQAAADQINRRTEFKVTSTDFIQ